MHALHLAIAAVLMVTETVLRDQLFESSGLKISTVFSC